MLTNDQKWIAPETVAEAMLELLTGEEYVGGTVLEVSGCGTRVVKMIGVSIFILLSFRKGKDWGEERILCMCV